MPGIGEKTAAELLIQFGSVEGILANLDAVSGEKRRESLRAARRRGRKSKQLATIDRAVPLTIDLGDVVVEPPDRSTMAELFRKLEFRALLKRMDELEEALPGAAPRAGRAHRHRVARGRARGISAGCRARLAVAPAGEGRFAVAAARRARWSLRRHRATAGRGAQPPRRDHPRAASGRARAGRRHRAGRLPGRSRPLGLRDRRPGPGARDRDRGGRRRGDRRAASRAAAAALRLHPELLRRVRGAARWATSTARSSCR